MGYLSQKLGGLMRLPGVKIRLDACHQQTPSFWHQRMQLHNVIRVKSPGVNDAQATDCVMKTPAPRNLLQFHGASAHTNHTHSAESRRQSASQRVPSCLKVGLQVAGLLQSRTAGFHSQAGRVGSPVSGGDPLPSHGSGGDWRV